MKIFLKKFLLLGIINTFNCDFYLIEEDGHIQCFDGNNSVKVISILPSSAYFCTESIPVKYKEVVRINNLKSTIKNGIKDTDLDYEFLDNFLDENKRKYYYVINESATFQFDVAAKECIWFTITMCSKCDLRSFSYNERTPCSFGNFKLEAIHFCTEPNESINKFTITTEYSGTKFGLRLWYLSKIYTYSPAKYCQNDKGNVLKSDNLISTNKTRFNLNKLENKCKHNCIICIHDNCLEYTVPHYNYKYLYILILIPIIFLIIVVFYRLKQKCKINLDSEIYYKFFRKNNSTNIDEQHLYDYVRYNNENDEDGYLKVSTRYTRDEEPVNNYANVVNP